MFLSTQYSILCIYLYIFVYIYCKYVIKYLFLLSENKESYYIIIMTYKKDFLTVNSNPSCYLLRLISGKYLHHFFDLSLKSLSGRLIQINIINTRLLFQY